MLLLDLGNSRLKWALATSRGALRQHAMPWNTLAVESWAERFGPKLKGSVAHGVSVSRPERVRALEAALLGAGFAGVRWLQSTDPFPGLRCGYREPWRLGADRWAGIIGAFSAAGADRPVAVVDAGTAITLDLLNSQGRHLGGLIVPGEGLMASSLVQDTAGISARAEGTVQRPASASLIAARDTRGALAGGARLATWAAVEYWISAARRRHGSRLEVFVTGGGASPWRRMPAASRWHFRPALVLEGVQATANLRG